jgi:hypothetical protein
LVVIQGVGAREKKVEPPEGKILFSFLKQVLQEVMILDRI